MISIDEVAAAFDRKDYREAASLLKELRKQSPENPWVQFYVGQLYEVTGKLEAAEKVYREVLRLVTNPKIVAQARQGLQRVEAIPKERRKEAIARSKADPSQQQLGVLILEPISPEIKTQAAQRFARIMQLEPYSARLLLPTRSWRMYRTGAIGELQVYVEELRKAEIPAFCSAIADIQQIRVLRVSYFQSLSPHPTIICKNELDQQGQLTFEWGEVRQRVEGVLPIFKEIAVENHRRTQVNYKQETQDYAQICDLHIPSRRCILRLCDESYQFQQGVAFAPVQDKSGKGTPLRTDVVSVGVKWSNFLNFLKQELPQVPVWSGFTSFAETTLSESDMLERITHHIEVFRYAPSVWDPAFQLYSGLIFLKNS